MIVFLLYSWGDSLKLLISDKAKLTLFGIYRALRDSYFVLFTRFWWLLVISVVMSRFIDDVYLQVGLVGLCGFFWGIATVLAVRPSVGQKNYRYFTHFWYFVVTAFFLSLVFQAIKPLFLFHPVGFLSLAVGTYSPLYICCAFFVADAFVSLSDIGIGIMHGAKMIFYNFPLFLLVHGLLFVVWRLMFLALMTFASYPFAVIFGPLYMYYLRLLLLPAYACVINTLYIQRRHEQPEFYQSA